MHYLPPYTQIICNPFLEITHMSIQGDSKGINMLKRCDSKQKNESGILQCIDIGFLNTLTFWRFMKWSKNILCICSLGQCIKSKLQYFPSYTLLVMFFEVWQLCKEEKIHIMPWIGSFFPFLLQLLFSRQKIFLHSLVSLFFIKQNFS